METTNGNKIALAVLGALLGTMVLGVFSNAMFSPQKPAKPGYRAAIGRRRRGAGAAAAATPVTPLPVLLAKADPAKGETDAKACQACHNFEKGGGAKVGPPLWGVVGRPVASIAGFAYSDALKAMGGDWTYDKLNAWITKPSAMAAGHQDGLPRRVGRRPSAPTSWPFCKSSRITRFRSLKWPLQRPPLRRRRRLQLPRRRRRLRPRRRPLLPRQRCLRRPLCGRDAGDKALTTLAGD